jgi:hypothetical protein
VRRQRRWLRHGKRMSSNFSVLQRRMKVARRNGEVRTEYWNRKLVVDYLLYDARIICVKFWGSSKSDAGYQPRVANDCGAQFYSNEEHFPFLLLIRNQML